MSDVYFLRKGNRFLDDNDQFVLPAIYGVRPNPKVSVEFASEAAAVAKAEALGVSLDLIKVVCVPKREAE